MGIIYEGSNRLFHLQSKTSSYIFQISGEGFLIHHYYGKKIRSTHPDHMFKVWERATFSPTPSKEHPKLSFDDMPCEYPAFGQSDYRIPAVMVQLENGSSITELVYERHQILDGKPKIEGLPATYIEDSTEANTLEVTLVDHLIQLEVTLVYTVFEDEGVITRHVRYKNIGHEAVKLNRVMSSAVDFERDDMDLLYLSGAWARERHIERKPLSSGIVQIDSKRGASSHQRNPFVALLGRDTTEDHGEAYGFSLVYSGSFLAEVEVDQFSNTRLTMGINPFDFSWHLEPTEEFVTPECVMVYAANGLGEMSRIYHKLYRTRLARGKYRDEVRPVLVNNWEGTYFDFTADKLLNIAKEGQKLGLELFVLDDGWFGKRNDDRSSLGDWFVNLDKLPKGLESLVQSINSMGMQFGLWFEPEMMSPDSELYKEHPNWCIHVSGRRRTEGRRQLILDFSREDVRDHIITVISEILSRVNIGYVKWDMNRNMTEIGSELLPAYRQRETAHRYILGLYEVMEKITTSFPHILFESCSGGGGRFDPGILYYMPQTWTSDNTDAIERIKIQYGTSMVYPISAMGAHVSAVPNHQVHRMTSLKLRGDVAMSGNFGYELDLSLLTEVEKEEIKAQVAQYKELRALIQFGEFYRLLSPFERNEAAWMIVSENKKEAFVAYFRVMAKPNDNKHRLRLKGLLEDEDYLVNGEVWGGDVLQASGILLPYVHGDFTSHTWHIVIK